MKARIFGIPGEAIHLMDGTGADHEAKNLSDLVKNQMTMERKREIVRQVMEATGRNSKTKPVKDK